MSDPIYTAFTVRRYRQPDGVLRVMERDELPAGCPGWVRAFFIEDVPPDAIRADHAHRRCHQVFVMLAGSAWCSVETPAGKKAQFPLRASEDVAVWIPPWRWVRLTSWTPEAQLLVFASEPYDYPAEYIEDHKVFREGP